MRRPTQNEFASPRKGNRTWREETIYAVWNGQLSEIMTHIHRGIVFDAYFYVADKKQIPKHLHGAKSHNKLFQHFNQKFLDEYQESLRRATNNPDDLMLVFKG